MVRRNRAAVISTRLRDPQDLVLKGACLFGLEPSQFQQAHSLRRAAGQAASKHDRGNLCATFTGNGRERDIRGSCTIQPLRQLVSGAPQRSSLIGGGVRGVEQGRDGPPGHGVGLGFLGPSQEAGDLFTLEWRSKAVEWRSQLGAQADQSDRSRHARPRVQASDRSFRHWPRI